MPQIRNTNIYPYDTTISANDYVIGSDADTSNKKTKNYKVGDLAAYIAEYIQVVVAGQDKIIRGSVFPTDEAFTFSSTPISYAYRGTYNVAPARNSIVLTTPGSGMKRIDVFAIDIIANALVVLRGEEDATTPLEPSIEFGTQMRVTAVLVDENGIVGLTREQIYNENAGEPTEWAITETEVGTGVFNPDSTVDPAVGTKSISCTTIVDGNILEFENDTASYSGFDSIYLRIKNTDVTDLGIRISMFNDTTEVSTIPVDIISGLYGYTLSNTTEHLFLNIPLTEFGLSGDFNKIKFEFSSLTADDIDLVYIDDIALIGGLEIPPQGLRWLDLVDTDSSYDGKRAYIPMVNAVETALRLIDSNQFLQVTDFYTGNAVLDPRVIWLGDMNYRILASRFIINNTYYTENVSTDVTLSDGDATNPRIDVFYIEKVDDDTPAVGGVLEGTPNASPTEETLDPDQAKVAIKIVAANETTSDVEEELVYNENLGEPTEWDSSDLSSDVDMDYAIDPDTGSLCIQTNPTASAGTRITFTKATQYDYNAEGILTLRMKVDFAWAEDVSISFTLSDGTDDSNTVTLDSNQLFLLGFDTNTIETWQDLAIPMSVFGSVLSTFNELKLFINNRSGFISTNNFDNIRFQVGITNTDPDVNLNLQQVTDNGNVTTNSMQSPQINSNQLSETNWFNINKDFFSLGDFSSGGGLNAYDGNWEKYFSLFDPNNDPDVLNLYIDTTDNLTDVWFSDLQTYISNQVKTPTEIVGKVSVNNGVTTIEQSFDDNLATLNFAQPTIDDHVYKIPASSEAAQTWYLPIKILGATANSEGVVTPTATSTADTGTEIDLSNPLGNYCNRASANSTSTYTTANAVIGGKAKVLINKSGAAPTITGASLVSGSTFVASTDMDMCVEYDGTNVEYYFLER